MSAGRKAREGKGNPVAGLSASKGKKAKDGLRGQVGACTPLTALGWHGVKQHSDSSRLWGLIMPRKLIKEK